MSAAPTLLIGLGGTGCKIIERVSKMVTPEERANLALCGFDTDANELDEIKERNPLVRTVQTSTKQSVGEYLNLDTHARDTWFPVNAILNGKTLTEGAGQVRSISRLAFETAIRAGKIESLHEAIQSLYRVEENKAEQALRVVIVSSLAGGTGSGLILPVAMYVKNYLKTHFRQSANITRGFFILPEVFYEVIVSESERNNLKANAYATLRELDAFLMKGDATLDEKFKDSVKIEFPRIASSGYEEYDVRPYDFCFLFDAQNAEGGKLNSFDQYLDHAANIIYAQSIGPMNKRSNSSEDNTIRKLAAENGRNRYAGAGASMLIYPFEDIRSFIALKWAKQCVSSQWLVYDNMYKEIRTENNKKAERGLAVQNIDAGQFYVQQIEALASQKDPFSLSITKSCAVYAADGVTKQSDRWKNYVHAVLKKVETDITNMNDELQTKAEEVSAAIGQLDKEWDEYGEAYMTLESYRQMIANYVDEAAQTIAYAMFKAPKYGQIDSADYKLEKHLVTNDNNFLHPNAIRYLLIKINQYMTKMKAGLDSDIEEIEQYYETFEKNTFDDPETEEVETWEDRIEKESAKKRIGKKASANQEEIKQKLRAYYNKIEEYAVMAAQKAVLDQGSVYIDSLIKSFESFYRTFESKVETIDKTIDEIYRKYSDSKGTTARYVCASRECLDKMYEKKPYLGSAVVIDAELAKEIYFKVNAYAALTEKPGNNRYFSNLFDEGILGYFETAVMRDYGGDIDVDIIQAIENEAIYENGYDEQENSDVLIDQYIRKTISDTRNLSCPFIESPLGEQRESIYSCTFTSELAPQKGDDSPKAELIRKELMNFGGAPNKEIPRNRITFYQSFYGLRANDLSKFAPAKTTLTNVRPAGDYYKAYFELISRINPETHKSRQISPHIDRWWHNISKMPDLDEENQLKQEKEVYAAFFWGIMENLIEMFDDDSTNVYKINIDKLDMKDDQLIVSNGTPCDKLYEVLDAISIYPELAQKILGKINLRIQNEKNDDESLEEGLLMNSLGRFALDDPGLGKGANKKPATSIFSIPMMMKKSSVQEAYFEDDAIQILKVELEEIRRYLANFVSAKELPGEMKKILDEQFKNFLADVAIEKETNPTLCRESLFYRTCSIIGNEYDELGFSKVQSEIEGIVRTMRK